MDADYLEKLYDLGDQQLLEIVAFRLSEYIPEARDVLGLIMKERGFTETDLAEYRSLYLVRTSFAATCDNCGTELILERPELEVGYFTCPDCSNKQTITYQEDWFRSPAEPAEFDESEESTSPEVPAEPIEEPVAEEVVAETPEGNDLVNCVQCGIELKDDEVFVSRGEFCCEQCYGKLESAPPTDAGPDSDKS
jgi:hypothetical protein